MNDTQHSNDSTRRKHRRYDPAFKRQAVEHWMLSGKPCRQIAAELGVDQQSLAKWKKKFTQEAPAQVAGTLEALQAENRRLQRELQRVARQRDILKKTLGIISEPSDNVL
jgi:transposase